MENEACHDRCREKLGDFIEHFIPFIIKLIAKAEFWRPEFPFRPTPRKKPVEAGALAIARNVVWSPHTKNNVDFADRPQTRSNSVDQHLVFASDAKLVLANFVLDLCTHHIPFVFALMG